MNSVVKFIGISGSLRKDSYNTALLKAALNVLPEGVEMELISWDEIPVYNADFDIPAKEERPEPVQKFREAIANADGMVIASPEYNYGIPGGLKNALDWASRGQDTPLKGKPVALMGASAGMWGTSKMQISMLSFFLAMDMQPVFKPEILVARAQEKIDENGKLIDEKAIEFIQKKLEALKELCFKNKK